MKGQRTWKILLGGIILIAVECSIAFIAVKYRDYTETMYFVSQIFNCIVVALGVVFAAWQYYQYTSDSKRNTDIIRVQKAIDLAQFFKDNILDKYSPLEYIMDQSGSNKILGKITPGNMQTFDFQEMRRYISEDDSANLRKIQESNAFLTALISANAIFDMHFQINTIINNVRDLGDNKKEVTFSIEKTPVINTFLRDYINQTLNNLEFFAMHFVHNTADSSVVYQSLHQVYIKTVEQLYYFIADLNKDPVEKYFTNTISLYQKWINEKKRNDTKRSDNDRQLQTHGTVIN